MVDRVFGAAGDRIIIEDCLEGEEASIMAFTDGENLIAMPPSQDHKRVFDNDAGPNTGGMGAYSPVPVVPGQCCRRCRQSDLAAGQSRRSATSESHTKACSTPGSW